MVDSLVEVISVGEDFNEDVPIDVFTDDKCDVILAKMEDIDVFVDDVLVNVTVEGTIDGVDNIVALGVAVESPEV